MVIWMILWKSGIKTLLSTKILLQMGGFAPWRDIFSWQMCMERLDLDGGWRLQI